MYIAGVQGSGIICAAGLSEDNWKPELCYWGEYSHAYVLKLPLCMASASLLSEGLKLGNFQT